MNIKFFDNNLLDGKIKNRLIENDFENRFSLKQKVYYNFIRPLIPISVRQKLQEKLNAGVEWKKDFIDDSSS